MQGVQKFMQRYADLLEEKADSYPKYTASMRELAKICQNLQNRQHNLSMKLCSQRGFYLWFSIWNRMHPVSLLVV